MLLFVTVFYQFEACTSSRRVGCEVITAVQLGYLEVTVHEKLFSGWPGPFVKIEGRCD
jgi:hypothetical protein